MSEPEQKINIAVKDMIDRVGDLLALASSPAVIEVLVLLNAMGITNQFNLNKNGQGFNGYAVNLTAPTVMIYTPTGQQPGSGREIRISNP